MIGLEPFVTPSTEGGVKLIREAKATAFVAIEGRTAYGRPGSRYTMTVDPPPQRWAGGG